MNDVFTPESVTFDNVTALIADAKSKISDNKHLILDMTKASDNFDSTAVCLLLDLVRDANHKKHTVEIRNIGGRLKKLLKLYQLENFFSSEFQRNAVA